MKKNRTLEQIKLEETGKIYGFLKIIKLLPSSISPKGMRIGIKAVVECLLCNKGVIKTVLLHNLIKGQVISCRCAINKTKNGFKHGLTNHPYYDTCNGAILRCNPPGNIDYYGRGIRCFWPLAKIHEFIKYLDENLPPKQIGESLDRIDYNGNYEPGNLRWADRDTQANNKRPFITNFQYEEIIRENDILKSNIDFLNQFLDLNG